MRIISGTFKGKKIISPKDKLTRPLKDLTKESIFNILKHTNKFFINLENSDVLDLFSGTGSFGIECLSRGARFVTFVENYKGIIPILKKNLKTLNLIDKYEIVEKNIFSEFNIKFFKKKFNIIFLDPPYKERELGELLKKIVQEKLLTPKGVIIIHRHKKQNDIYPEKLEIIDEKKYGLSKIIFLKILN